MRDAAGRLSKGGAVTTASLCFTSAALSFGAGLPQDVIDAFAYTLTKAQQVARLAGKDPTSEAYFDAMVEELRRLGWGSLPWQTATAQPFSHAPGGASVSPLALVMQAIAAFLAQALPSLATEFPDTQWLSRVAENLQQVPPNVEAALDQWWNGTRIDAFGQTMTISSLVTLFGTPFLAGGYFVFAFSAASWRSLLQPTSAIALTSYPMLLQLDLSVWHSEAAALKTELKDDVRKTIYHTPLDLGVAGTWQAA